jgi:hypothetical protein
VELNGRESGIVRDPRTGAVTAFHRTPGYETYRGLGWYGAIVQEPPRQTGGRKARATGTKRTSGVRRAA